MLRCTFEHVLWFASADALMGLVCRSAPSGLMDAFGRLRLRLGEKLFCESKFSSLCARRARFWKTSPAHPCGIEVFSFMRASMRAFGKLLLHLLVERKGVPYDRMSYRRFPLRRKDAAIKETFDRPPPKRILFASLINPEISSQHKETADSLH